MASWDDWRTCDDSCSCLSPSRVSFRGVKNGRGRSLRHVVETVYLPYAASSPLAPAPAVDLVTFLSRGQNIRARTSGTKLISLHLAPGPIHYRDLSLSSSTLKFLKPRSRRAWAHNVINTARYARNVRVARTRKVSRTRPRGPPEKSRDKTAANVSRACGRVRR